MSNRSEEHIGILRGILAEFAKYPEARNIQDLMRIRIREGVASTANAWAGGVERDGRGGFGMLWLSLVDTAAQMHPDWYVREGRQGLDAYRPRKHSTIRTRRALVAWLALHHPDIAFGLEDEAWSAPAS